MMSAVGCVNAVNHRRTVIIDMLDSQNITISKKNYRNIIDTITAFSIAGILLLLMVIESHLMVAKFTVLAMLLIQMSCVTSEHYVRHRTRDFTDMYTIGIEKGSFGISFWFWCMGGGISGNGDARGIGLRGGTFGFYETGGKRRINLFSDSQYNSSSNRMGNSMLLQNSLEHRPAYEDDRRDKEKSFETLNLLMIFPIPSHKTTHYISSGCDAPLFTEFSIGLYYGVRLGYNFYESLDFLLGLASLDIAQDDTE